MRFELSERVYTERDGNEVLDDVVRHFKKIAEVAKISDAEVVVTEIEKMFWSVIRKDRTNINLTKIKNGYSIVADVRYYQSILFWVVVVLGIPVSGGFLSIAVVGLYFWEKHIVRKAVGETLHRLSDDFNNAPTSEAYKVPRATNATDELVKLAELRDRGHLTDEEFASRKKQILQNR